MRELIITLPTASDPLGRWLEANHVAINIHVSMGKYHIEARWKKLHSYSDNEGEHSEIWNVNRSGTDPALTFGLVLEAVAKKIGKPLP